MALICVFKRVEISVFGGYVLVVACKDEDRLA